MAWFIMPHLLALVEWMRSAFRRQQGQGLVEYALILVLVALVIIATLVLLGGRLGGTFGTVNKAIDPTNLAKTATAMAS
jgi:pilus assembly protein Flp/PilA